MAASEMISTHCELLQDRGLTYVVSDKILTNKTSLRCLAEGVKFCAKNSSLFFLINSKENGFHSKTFNTIIFLGTCCLRFVPKQRLK